MNLLPSLINQLAHAVEHYEPYLTEPVPGCRSDNMRAKNETRRLEAQKKYISVLTNDWQDSFQIAAKANVTRNSAATIMRSLIDSGLIEQKETKKGSAKKFFWRLAQSN